MLLQSSLATTSSAHCFLISFIFHDPPPTELYTLSLHDALPISTTSTELARSTVSLLNPITEGRRSPPPAARTGDRRPSVDRKSTRLNSSHLGISYAVFCLKKKKK